MKKLLIIFLLLLQFVILPQNNFIQQITNGDFDARNPFIYKDEYGFYDNSIFFELHNNANSNIYYMKYNSNNVKFDDMVALTTSNYQNINPSFHPAMGIIYQTNQNGNWDIAFIPDSAGIWGNSKFFTTSMEDEINPKYFELSEDYFRIFQDSTNILFSRNGDVVFLAYNHNQITEEVIFQSDSECTYSEYIGLEISPWWGDPGFYIFAIEKDNQDNKRIVSKYKPYHGLLTDKVILKDNCDCSGIDIQYADYNILGLFYQDSVQGQKRYYEIENPTSPNATIFSVPITHQGNLTSFDIYYFNIITERTEAIAEPQLYMPHTYQVEQNGIKKVRIDITEWGLWNDDSLLQVSVSNPQLAIGSVGEDNGGIVVYTVWEDSVDGNIQLFGTRRHLAYGFVEDESYSNDFVLYQNYPNPFNPATKIEFKLLKATDVKFNVFNLLGEKVFEQKYGYQTAGSYKVNFDGKNLPSGVYVYSIYTNENRLSRKMLLMK